MSAAYVVGSDMADLILQQDDMNEGENALFHKMPLTVGKYYF